jgi:glycosyltransferase involved in cell wall biosynthesis
VRIALNAQLLSRAHSYRSGGISRHIYHLLRELSRRPEDGDYEVFAPEAPDTADPLAGGSLRFHATGALTARPPLRIAWEQAVLPVQLARLKPNLLHSLAYASPLVWRGPTVLTIYDLSFLRFADAFKTGNRLYLSAITRVSARRARRVVTISQQSRHDIVHLLGVPPERVVVTYLAAEPRYRPLPAHEVAAFKAARALPDHFVLYLGTLEPRKNLIGLIEAYARVAKPRPPLYVAGATGWRYSAIFEAVVGLGVEEDVRFVGFLPEDELPLWYNAAHLFAFPSRYEGFGLPVLEAMACGTPVITSNAASLPEVAGQAAQMVSPDDRSALAAAMQEVLDSPQRRAAMREAGLQQASRFRWSSTADQTLAAYRAALADRG